MSVEKFLSLAATQEGAPYVWAGKGESVFGALHPFTNKDGKPQLVLDCSGLVTWCLHKAGWQVKGQFWADRMWKEWPHTDAPEPGDLVLYGSPLKSTHVEIVMPDGRFFGAIGGGSKTTKPTPGACVQYRSKPRRDVLGYVVNPLRAQTDSKPVT